MQLLPSTAQEIARRTGGEKFVVGDLTEARINILYGCNYLRYLLDQFGGSTTAAVAAYNAGVTNVQAWIARKGGGPCIAPTSPLPRRAAMSGTSATRQRSIGALTAPCLVRRRPVSRRSAERASVCRVATGAGPGACEHTFGA